MSETLFDLGPPVAKVWPTAPFKEAFIVAAYRIPSGDMGNYWRIWTDLWFTREAAQQAADKLAGCWGERRIYRIPGDESNRPEGAERR